MGRIEEALKRAAAGRDAPETPAPDPAGAETTDTPFVSAWQEEGSTAAPYARRAPATGRPERRPPASSSLQLDSQIAMGWQPFDESEEGKLVIMPQVDPAAMDGYARLAASLRESRASGRGVKTIAISSSVAGEGRTLTAINLALSLGRPDSRVLLIDADLRNARIHQIFQVSATSGLHDCLRAEDPIAMPVIGLTAGVTLLPAGTAGSTPAALDSDRMRQLLADAAQEYDWVILDTAPVLPAQPAGLPAGMVDGVLFVVRAAQTPRKVVKQAFGLIDRERVIGMVLNQGRA